MATIEELKASIARRLEALEAVQAEQRTRKEQLKDALLNDENYIKLQDEAKVAASKLSSEKSALLNEPEYRKLKADEKDTAKEIKDLQALLTGELFAFTKETDSFQIDTGSGLHNIQYKAKLVKTDQPTLV